MREVLQQISIKLSKHDPPVYLAQHDPSQYFQSDLFAIRRHQSNIYVTLFFPISMYEKPFQLYHIQTIPVPLNHSTAHVSQLLDLHEYFAMNQLLNVYTIMSKLDIGSCKGKNPKLCHVLIQNHNLNDFTCESALFLDNPAAIHERCDFRFVHKGLIPSIIQLEPSVFLLSNTSNATIMCKDQVTEIVSCSYCQVKLPCHCQLHSDRYFIPPRLGGCATSKSNTTVLFPLNLALLQHFFPTKQLKNIHSNSLFTSQPNITVPDFKLFTDQVTTTIANDKRYHLSLRKMVSAAKAKEQVFSNLADTLAYAKGQQVDWTWFNVISIVSITVSIMTSLVIMWLVRKTYILAVAVQVLGNSKTATSAAVPSFNYFALTTLADDLLVPENKCNDLMSWIEWSNLAIGLLIFTIGLSLFVFSQCRKITSKTMFVLEITNGTACTRVDIMSVTKCPEFWELSQSVQPDIQVIGTVRPRLQIDWNKAKLVNKSLRVDLPYTVSLGFTQHFRVKRIINLKTFYAFPYFLHHDMAVVPKVTGNLIGNTQAKLYPSLQN